jgi:amino acid transporter
MNILSGKLNFCFISSHLLKVLSFIVFVYIESIIAAFAAVAIFLVSYFLRSTIPNRTNRIKRRSAIDSLNWICAYILVFWFIASTDRRIVNEVIDFFSAKKLTGEFIILFSVYFISSYLLDRKDVTSMSEAEIDSYYEQ